jgi:hypothetical protein
LKDEPPNVLSQLLEASAAIKNDVIKSFRRHGSVFASCYHCAKSNLKMIPDEQRE